MKWLLGIPVLIVGGLLLAGSSNPTRVNALSGSAKVGNNPGSIRSGGALKPAAIHELAAFSGGCFWGTEDYFRNVKGVVATAVGYTGGITKNPTYEDVCSHLTKHAETVLIEFDPKVISYPKLVREFWRAHDPTQLNRQGPDYGDQYRTAIWTYSPTQMQLAKAEIQRQQKLESDKIVTELKPAERFWLAEEYHQQYDEKTGRHSCPAPRKFPTDGKDGNGGGGGQ